jgi:peptidoglycan-associated lipoprotein
MNITRLTSLSRPSRLSRLSRLSLLSAVAAAALLAACSTPTDLSSKTAAPVETRQTTPLPPKAAAATPAVPSATPQSRVATVDLAAASAGATAASAQAAALAAAGPAQRVIYFDFDSFVIKDDFKPTIEGHAKVLAANRSKRITIEGHTDERGGHEYNLALGQKRAEAVAKSLELLGVGDNQIEAVSFGEERPADPGHDESAWAKNRRAELKDR